MRYVTGPVDLTRMKLVSHRSIGLWRVVSVRVRRCSKSHGSGRIGSTSLQIPRVGSGRVNSFFKSHGSGHAMLVGLACTAILSQHCHTYDDNGALSGKVMPDAINSTINATTPPPVPTPERGPVTSYRVRTISHPFWAWSPLCPLSRNST